MRTDDSTNRPQFWIIEKGQKGVERVELSEALLNRRSVRRFTDERVPDGTIEEILRYAPWVPNHHVSEPWRFLVVTGESLRALAELRQRAVLTKRQGQEGASERAERAREEFLQASHVIVLVQKLDPRPVRREEDYAAMAMSAYNLMLAAWERGVGSYWNTGPLIDDPDVKAWLQLGDDERPIGFLRMGWPETVPVQRRTPAVERTEWRR
jgi:nitroreductase